MKQGQLFKYTIFFVMLFALFVMLLILVFGKGSFTGIASRFV